MRLSRIAGLTSALITLACACSDGGDDSQADDTDSGPSSAQTAGSHATKPNGSGGVNAAAHDAGSTPPTPALDAGATGAGSGGRNGSGGTSGNDAGGGASGTDAGAEPEYEAGQWIRACPSTRPDATNSGVPPDVDLTVVDHDVTVSEDGTHVDAQDIHGFLIIDANDVQVTRTIVRGGIATQNGAGIVVRSGTDITITDSEVGLEHPSAWLDGVSGSNLHVRRCNIHGGVDGMKVGSNSNVECSFIHDMQAFDSDPNQNGGPTHNDAIQILSGTNIRILGNNLLAAKDQNAAIQVTQDFGEVGDLSIEANYADGGGCTFNFSHNGGDGLEVTTRNNRFGRNSFYDCPILTSTKTTLDSLGDVWDDDGTKVPVQTHD